MSWLWDRAELHGMREFQLALERFEETLETMGEEAGHESAKKIAHTARKMMPVGPAEGGHVRDTARADGMAAVLGGTFFPCTGWLEFGGRVGRGNKVGAGIWRPKALPHGRYLWPSYMIHYNEVSKIQDDEMVETARQAGLEVDG